MSVHSQGAAQILRPNLAFEVEHLGVPDYDACPGRGAQFEAHPPDEILSKVDHIDSWTLLSEGAWGEFHEASYRFVWLRLETACGGGEGGGGSP